jgi:hypothetical protein
MSKPERTFYEGTSCRPLSSTAASLPAPASPQGSQPEEAPPAPVGRLYLVKEGFDSRAETLPDGEGVILQAFAEEALAHAFLRRLTREDWLRNPWFSLSSTTSLTPGLLRDLVMDLGLEPPPLESVAEDQAWLAWWNGTSPRLAGWQRERFLDALLDRSPGYRIVPVDLAE